MPEYLAPGVYVEETSFRAKSIEGVSTSTTAFVGPTRKGPIAGGQSPMQPELLTSFGDFVRMFGGLNSLDFGKPKPQLNYLAHAVLNYFNEGGSRLYVLRVADLPDPENPSDPTKAAPASVQLATASNQVIFNARSVGKGGNGIITVREILSCATLAAATNAPAGTLLRGIGSAGGDPARILGKEPGPFAVHSGGVLRLLVGNKNNDPAVKSCDLVFNGISLEATSPDALADLIDLSGTGVNNILRIKFEDSPEQSIQLTKPQYTPADLVSEINPKLKGGYARLDGSTNPHLVIGTDHLGWGGSVTVYVNDNFGFTKDPSGTASDPSKKIESAYDPLHPLINNVGNLDAVTVADLNNLLMNQWNAANSGYELKASDVNGHVALSTTLTGDKATLAVADATNTSPGHQIVSEHNSFCLILPIPGTPPAQGSNIQLFCKDGLTNNWIDSNGNATFSPGTTVPTAKVGNFISLTVAVQDADGESEIFDDISLNSSDVRFIGNVLRQIPTNRADTLGHLVWCDTSAGGNSLKLHQALFSADPVEISGDEANGLTASFKLTGGKDGSEPQAGDPETKGTYAAAFEQLRGLEDVSIVAAPGHASFAADNYQAIQGLLISHVEKPRAYRIAVLETPPSETPGDARLERARIDSSRAALYYPWVTVANPLARPGSAEPREIQLPPSGFICGIYARNDSEKTVAKAPANEVVLSALRFERDVNFAENQLLNPLGINCLRFFPGRGYRVWGARTASSDPEWKYVNVRRYFNFLEASIDRGTQWAVFENNGERLWANIRQTIESFLYNEWVSGNLLGATTKEAYFVRCDRSTMTQNDLDNGRLICLIGVAALKPAEFVIFRIGQKTADVQS